MTFEWGPEGEQLCKEGHYLAGELALSLGVPDPLNLYNRATALRRLQRYQEAWDVAKRAEAVGNNDTIQNILGCLALDMMRPKEAIALLDPIKHKYHAWRFSYAIACLMAERWEEGFHHYEARLHQHSQPLPMWEGGDLQGQTLGVICEQGLGDSIMFSRFRELIPGKHVFMTPNLLTRILGGRSGNCSFDAWKMIPLMSLPYRLGLKDLPPPKPYIRPLDRFELPRLCDTRLNIGLIWRSKSGGFLRKRDEIEHGATKSIPLAELLPLATLPGVKLYSLQHDGDKDIGELGAGPLIQNLGPQIMDFADLAAFMQEMDVIVSADTGPAHLAGAMGKPGYVLCPYAGAWQWGEGNRSTWYPSLQILRQTKPNSWAEPVGNLLKELR